MITDQFFNPPPAFELLNALPLGIVYEYTEL
jgi:hypothetical protein